MKDCFRDGRLLLFSFIYKYKLSDYYNSEALIMTRSEMVV